MGVNRIACRGGLLAVGFCMLVMAASANADVISGQGALDPCWGWDFSEQVSLCYLENPDIVVAFVEDPPHQLGLRIGVTGWASVIMLPDSSFDELRFAPEDSSSYVYDLPALLNTTYVARTREGHYAKFRFLQLPYLVPIIEYVYQPDGSRRLFNVIGVEKSTWGAVKALFR